LNEATNNATPPDPNHGWDRGWDEHQLNQLRRMAALPLSVKIAWLEEAQQIVLHLDANRVRAASPKSDTSALPDEAR